MRNVDSEIINRAWLARKRLEFDTILADPSVPGIIKERLRPTCEEFHWILDRPGP